ncbi:hypothetical protein TNCT_311161 [Trichonephila clavata]|uniref:Uncharacterized protein n=1 Tax=Trichonephila clavata TaxID=2740835 RepID=A0A8X6IZP6_TRICU|nr:hypothetical protein TNCT_311161 [Trichonephila clavata]
MSPEFFSRNHAFFLERILQRNPLGKKRTLFILSSLSLIPCNLRLVTVRVPLMIGCKRFAPFAGSEKNRCRFDEAARVNRGPCSKTSNIEIGKCSLRHPNVRGTEDGLGLRENSGWITHFEE